MKIVPVTKARKQIQDVVDKVHYTKEPLIISKNNKPWVMIKPLPEDDEELNKIIGKK